MIGNLKRSVECSLQVGREPATRVLLGIIVLCFVGCEAQSPRAPSILLIVIDTLRADAVSFYGSSRDTTPQLDVLARHGIAYENAYAPAPWTLPSHATLLTGLEVEQHRVGTGDGSILRAGVTTLAERLAHEGYETVAFAENPLVSGPFGILRGFERQRASRVDRLTALAAFDPSADLELAYEVKELDVLGEIEEWLEGRSNERPYLLFVNLFDPHAPYTIRDDNRFVSEAVTAGSLRDRTSRPSYRLCAAIPAIEEVDLLRGLYLGDVAAADNKVGRILAKLRDAGLTENLITIVTSDHGEHFGERRMMGHEFSLHGALLRVPLIVHGLAGRAPAVVDQAVGLGDIAPSILKWVGLEDVAPLSGKTLPESTEGDASARRFIAMYADSVSEPPEDFVLPPSLLMEKERQKKRSHCGPSDPVFGGMAALMRYPMKFVWFEGYPSELYDLSWDPHERSNLATRRPDVAARFAAEFEAFSQKAALFTPEGEAAAPLSEEALEALRALGYVEE